MTSPQVVVLTTDGQAMVRSIAARAGRVRGIRTSERLPRIATAMPVTRTAASMPNALAMIGGIAEPAMSHRAAEV